MSEFSSLKLLKNRIRGSRPPMVKVTSNQRMEGGEIGETEVEDHVPPVIDAPKEDDIVPEEINESIEEALPPMCFPASGGNNVQWLCEACNNECLMITRESRCICGHRRKDHLAEPSGKSKGLSCSSKACPCINFFYIVGEGSWILRCQCKHKHIDHHPDRFPYPCKKCKACSAFDSPWVCNCGHKWSQHTQRLRPSLSAPVQHPTPTTTASRVNFAVRKDGML